MPYAILRFQKRKAGGVAACERHNERKKEAYKSNPDIDMERSKNNYHLVNPPRYTYKKEINQMVKEAGCKVRKDSVMMVETLITASPEFMNSLPPEEQKAYFQTALDFISERVGKQNILSAVVHMDERTPHMHLCFVPLTPDNKLSAKSILANTVLKKEHDGRISRDNKAWAKTIPMPEDGGDPRHSYALVVDKVNPGLTDLFLKQARKVLQAPEKGSVLEKLKQEPPERKPAAPKKREPER